MKTLLRATTAAATLVLLLVVAACAEQVDVADTDGDDTNGEAGTDVVATASTDLGEVLVDGEGMTLYMFDDDSPGESTCYDDCAANWPPLVVDDQAQADGDADEGLLGTTEREDGTTQVTYDGWPLYHWAGDGEPGDTDGQGVGDVWWVLAPDGTVVRDGDEQTGGGASGY